MKLTMIAKLMLTACFGLFSFVAIAQNKTITGKVTDEKGSPISGISVTAKGSKSGTTTGGDGNYKISVPQSTTTLVFSSVGFDKKEMAINSSSQVDVSLKSSNDNLSEVVVVGYGTARKKDVTGAVSVISAKNFNKGVITGPDQLFQGKLSGISVINNSGQPGAGTTVRIRGNASLREDDGQPLYVIDGVPLDGRNARPGLNSLGIGETPNVDPLLFINTNDIASVTVLKDASSCAIYGSRAANGIIVIETKKGSGAPKIDFNYQVGTSTIAKKWDVLDADGYRAALKQYGLTNGDYKGNADAQDAVLRRGSSENLNVAVSGGNEKSNYRLSLGYFGQQGIIKNTSLKKYLFGFNGSSKLISDKLSVDYAIKVANVNERVAPTATADGATSSLIGNMLRWNPTRNFVNADGTWNQPDGEINPVAMLNAYTDKASLLLGSGQMGVTYKITNELEARVFGSTFKQVGTRSAATQSYLNAPSVVDRGWASKGDRELTSDLYNATLTYKKNVNKDLRFDALVGYEYFKSNRSGSAISGQDFKDIPSSINYADILQYASQSSITTTSFKDITWELQSYFGRVNFSFQDKYQLTATLRADGSSKFGSENKYGYFPSFALGWNISNEDFMKDIKLVNSLKLRAGYGATGSQGFPPGASLGQYSFTQQASVLFNAPNPKLKWESEKQLNIGTDFTLLEKRLIGTIDYFRKDRTNILFYRQVALPGPAVKYFDNLPCDIINSGVEITLNYDIINKKDLNWNFGLNATFQKNELKNYNAGDILTGTLSGPGTSGTYVQKLLEGNPIDAFYTREFTGYDATGQATYTGGAAETRKYTGSPNPTTLLGVNSSVNYKKWTFSFAGYGMMGHMIYNNTANGYTSLGNLGKSNVDKRYIGTGESPGNSPKASSKYLEKGDFFRLANLTVNYNLGNIGTTVKNINLFVTANNLFVITKYTGFDPEANTNKPNNGVASQGIDYLSYPASRSFLAGFNISF